MRQLLSFLLGILAAIALTALLCTTVGIPAPWLSDYLLKHPEFLADRPQVVAASRAVLQKRTLDAQGAQRAELLHGQWASVLHAAFTPTLGRSDAGTVLLEFTDYTCQPCRTSAPVVRQALAENPDVRVAVLLLPIGGPIAEYAARIAYAAYKQNPGRFADLHHRLMEMSSSPSQEAVLAAAREAGLDVDQLEREFSAPENRAYLEQVRMLSNELGVTGVPAFALNDKLLLGGASADALSAMIAEARRGTL